MISRYIPTLPVALWGLSLFAAAPAIAHAEGAKPSPALAALDTDKDGTLSMDEAKAAADQKFDALDPNHDATLSAKETKGVVSKKVFGMADPDSDGTLDKTEWEALVTKRFQAADKDHDGTLDAKELASPKGKGLLKLLQQ